jgi:hypothetical protein
MDGYSLPIAIRAVSQLPPPRALTGIPPPYQGELLATLAFELSIIIKIIISDQRRGYSLAGKTDEITELCADRRYHSAFSRLRLLVEKERAAFLKLTDFERLSVRRGVATTTFGGKSRKPISPVDSSFQWIDAGMRVSAEEVAELVAEHSQLVRCYQRTVGPYQKAMTVANRARTRVQQSARFTSEWKKTEWTKVVFDSDAAPSFQLQGPALYLKGADSTWWERFTSRVGSAVAADAGRAPHRIALRDPQVLAEIKSRVNPTTNWDDAAEKYFKVQPVVAGAPPASADTGVEPNDWGVPPLTADTIKQMRSRLRAEDRRTEEWFDCHGGRGHPCNIYKEWKADLELAAVRDLPDFNWESADQDPRWLEAQRRAKKVYPSGGNMDQTLNELSWCLSRGIDDKLEFKPLTHLQYSAADWEAHRRKWWAAIERAQQARRPR